MSIRNLIIKKEIFLIGFLVLGLAAPNFIRGSDVISQSGCPSNTIVGETTATLSGEVTYDGGDRYVEVWFQYKDNTGYTWETPHQIRTGLGLFCYNVYNLQPCTTYYVTSVASNRGGTSFSEAKQFTTQCLRGSVDIKANNSNGPIDLNYQDYVNLTWNSQNVDYCTASGDWYGSKSLSGFENIRLNEVKTYNFTITCYYSHQTQTVTDSVMVNVLPKPPTVVTKPVIVTN